MPEGRLQKAGILLIAASVLLCGCGGPDGSALIDAGPLPDAALTPLARLTPSIETPRPLADDVPDDPAVKELLAAGRRHLKNQLHAAAVQSLTEAVALAPDSVAVRRELGLALFATGELDKAVAHLEAAAGDDVRVHLSLGRISEQTGRLQEAVVYYRTALACTAVSDDDRTEVDRARLLLSDVLRRLGRVAAALDALEPLDRSLFDRRYADWSAPLAQLAEHPESLLMRRGTLLLSLLRYDEAAETLDVAYRLNKSYAPVAMLYLKALAKAGRFDQADKVALEMMGGPLGAERIVDMMLVVCEAKDDPLVLRRLLGAYRAQYGMPPAAVLVAVARGMWTLGETDKAMAVLAEHQREVEDLAPLALTLAKWLLEQSRAVDAMEVLTDLLGRRPSAATKVERLLAGCRPARLDDGVAQWLATADDGVSEYRHAKLYLAGLVARRLRAADQARPLFEQTIEVAADFLPAYEALARIAIVGGQFDRVTDLADKVRALGHSQVADYLTGWSLLAQGRSAPAIQILADAVKADQGHVRSRILLARALVKAGQIDSAAEHLLQIVKTTGDSEAAELLVSLYLARYQSHTARGNRKEAQQSLAMARRVIGMLLKADANDVTALRLFASIQHRRGEYLQARATVDRLMVLAPDDVRARLLKVQVELRTAAAAEMLGPRRYDRARADLDVALAVRPEDPGILKQLAALQSGRRLYEQAAATLAQAMASDPADASLPFQRAVALRKAGLLDQVVDVLGAGTEADLAPRMRVLYVVTLAESGRVAEARRKLIEWIAQGDDAKLLYEIAMVRVQALADNVDGAVGLVDGLMAMVAEDNSHAWGMLAAAKLDALATAGRYNKLEAAAVELFTSIPAAKWLAAGSAGERMASVIVESFIPMESWRRRRELSAIANAPTPIDTAAAWLHVAGRHDQAAALTISAIGRLSGDDKDEAELADRLRLKLIQRLVEFGQTDRAIVVYERFLAASPDNIDLLSLSQSVYTRPRRSDGRRVAELLNRAAQLSPDDPELNNNLGYLRADEGEDLDQAQRMLEKALAAAPGPNVQDSLGWLRYKRGQFNQALDLLLLALNSPYGDNAVIYDHVGDTFWRLGRREQALEMWSEAADLAETEGELLGDRLDGDTHRVAQETAKKIQAAQRGGNPKVAPLGRGVRR